jgi:hypothetical protein
MENKRKNQGFSESYMENLNWFFELKQKVPEFLEKLKGEKIPGFFHYK